MGVLDRILRGCEVIPSKLNVRVVNRLLENLSVQLEKGRSQWFGLAYHLTDRRFKQARGDRARASQKHTQLPLRTEATRFLRKPDIQLGPRQRERPVIKFNKTLPAVH